MKNIVKIFTIALVFCLIFVLIGGGLTVIPTYALTSKGGVPDSSENSLNGSSWYVPSGWAVPDDSSIAFIGKVRYGYSTISFVDGATMTFNPSDDSVIFTQGQGGGDIFNIPITADFTIYFSSVQDEAVLSFFLTDNAIRIPLFDLTGSSWTVNSTSCISGYGQFELDFDLISGGVRSGHSSLYVGYTFDSTNFSFIPRSDSIVTSGAFTVRVGSKLQFKSTDDVTNDLTNGKLIEFLNGIATLDGVSPEPEPEPIYSIGDILYFNETLDLESLDLTLADTYEELSVFKIGQYNFSYHTLDDTSYSQFRVGKSPDTHNVMYPPTAVYDNNGWINQRYRVIILDSVPGSNIETWLSENSQVIDENQLDFAYNYGYTTGFDDGFNSGVNSDFAFDLLGNTLATPFNALDSIVLFEVGGVAVSVLTILYALIGFSLFIGILKMVAGG